MVPAFGLLCSCIGGLIVLGGSVLWIWMLVDCLVNESSQGNEKIIWALVILFTHFLEGVLYLLVRRPARIRELGH